MVFRPLIKRRVALFPMDVGAQHRKCQSLPRRDSVEIGPDAFQVVKPEDADRRLLGLFYVVVECLSSHQKVVSFGFSRAIVVASALMLVSPLEALAEQCQGESSFTKMPLFFAVAMIGATVTGLLARQRREELERVNDQLRQINTALRRQAKIESYAPSLTYAPVGRIAESEVIVDPNKQELMRILKTGKKFLRNQELDKAFVEFKAAFELAQSLGEHLEEKKAARGLGASLQRQGKYREAIKYHSRVLEISKKVGEDSGSTEAYGAIADCYTELGDLERAAKFYDRYISRLDK
ncbi:protein FLUORESCENT IN BLUE LIGHT, chloroplastic-like [Ananas comosus]|uniref:Protein FLUORESCENT IN BLUE LIGHT, chloroplastic-like n=1 Tax=Ananas comosus TaxID=4615 RepID=A0A6P5GWF8_ANACO|nr:protein FLUORESCENT IN BLUE LIGHT, chloroplastic-like [Ananas comosus]